MSKERIIFVILTLPISLLVGCMHGSGRGGTGSFSQPDSGPTSSSSAPRVYGTTTATAPGGGMATLTLTNAQGSAGGESPASPAEKELLESVRHLLIADRKLFPHPSQVTATLHPEEKGTVVLSGAVPNAQAKKKIIDRVASVPGVTRVEDRLQTDLPKDPGTAEFRDIVPQK